MMEPVMGFATPTKGMFDELGIFLQALLQVLWRTLVRRLGLAGKVKVQARYRQQDTMGAKGQPAKPDTPTPQIKGTLTDIRSIACLGDGCSTVRQTRYVQQSLQQILPTLAGYCQRRWLVLVAPPCVPELDELRAAGIDPSRVLVVHASGESGFTALERSLNAATCGAAVAWLEHTDSRALDRLRQAAEAGNTWGVLFRVPLVKKTSQRALTPSHGPAAQLKMAIYQA